MKTGCFWAVCSHCWGRAARFRVLGRGPRPRVPSHVALPGYSDSVNPVSSLPGWEPSQPLVLVREPGLVTPHLRAQRRPRGDGACCARGLAQTLPRLWAPCPAGRAVAPGTEHLPPAEGRRALSALPPRTPAAAGPLTGVSWPADAALRRLPERGAGPWVPLRLTLCSGGRSACF